MATAADTTLKKQMEELLRCSICHETLKEPRTLGCFHSFCKECLAKHVESQQEEAKAGHQHLFNCPLCRTQFQLSRGESVERSRPNFFINNLLEMLRIQERAPHLQCEFCSDQVPAVCTCVDCEHYLCRNCLTGHNKWPAHKDHVVLTLEELAKPENQAKAKPKSRCHKNGHDNRQLEFYCNTCQELVCMTCVLLDHPKPEHDCKPSDVVAKQRKEELKTTSAILQKKSHEGQNSLTKIKCASQNLQASNKKAKDAILKQEKEILQEFTKKLKHKTAALIVKVERKHNEVNQNLVKQHDDMKAYVEKVNGSLEFAKNMVEIGSNEEILSLGNEIKLNATNIEKKCPKTMWPVDLGYFRYLQKKSSRNIVDNVDLSDLGEIGMLEPPIKFLLATSTILDGDIDHAKQLAEWVEDKKFRWQLCYRASAHGWGVKDFDRKCVDVGPTVTLVKCGTNVFGAFNGCYGRSSTSSFLFSLRNNDNLPPVKCPSHRNNEPIFWYVTPGFQGVNFGGLDRKPDLHISNDANTNQLSFSNLGNVYQPPPGYQPGTPQTNALLAGSEHFTPTEIEVFRR